MVPICKEEATLAVTTRLQNRDDATPLGPAIDTILATLKPAQVDASAYCKAVAEEHTTDLP
jgi:hypothetical protein